MTRSKNVSGPIIAIIGDEQGLGGRIEARQMPVLEEKPGNRDIALAPGQLAGRAVGGGFFRHRKR